MQAGASEPIETSFELNDTLYARATVSPEDTDEVYIWLGANVMLSYPIEEAEAMLSEKQRAAEASLASCEEDLEFLKEQITVRLNFTLRFCWRVLAQLLKCGEKRLANILVVLVYVDSRSCHGPSLQLGYRTKTERKGRRHRR